MNHESFRELIALRLYGEIDADERTKLERHLESCAECRRFVVEIESGLGAVARGSSGRIANELPPDWSERLREATREQRRPTRIHPWWTAVAGFAAGVIAAAILGHGTESISIVERAPTTWDRFHNETPPPLATTEGRLAHLGEYLRR